MCGFPLNICWWKCATFSIGLRHQRKSIYFRFRLLKSNTTIDNSSTSYILPYLTLQYPLPWWSLPFVLPASPSSSRYLLWARRSSRVSVSTGLEIQRHILSRWGQSNEQQNYIWKLPKRHQKRKRNRSVRRILKCWVPISTQPVIRTVSILFACLVSCSYFYIPYSVVIVSHFSFL